ncbi:acyl-CoA thioesterase [Phototrophicus methaneseepsis]|uniref:Acyl-CoA thioesterase n=1 Tax=Phototrophicus methaneseepsis TaxID=2710758 RepID=A0A7S8EC92_9CHLR|nr:acyl-CoA thioesterase [Phototrophicus methaneseepsis]QPC84321.1 acyl-CoA thioesterase [Phototrophicus methaneseepsis]
MPRTYTRHFRVRHYECDIYGHLNNVNYVRYMQEAALDASADAGWPVARYDRIGHGWFVRETEIDYLKPLSHTERVGITTWVEDVRRVRSLRRYEFRREGEDDLAARASSEWVYINLETHQPTHVPDEVIYAYAPEGPPEHTNSRGHFPTLPPQPAGAFTQRHHVAWRDLDTAGHMNNACYLEYFEDAAAEFARPYGWPIQRMIEAGFGMVLRHMHIQYLQPALLDEEIEVATWFSGLHSFRVNRHFTMTRIRDGALLARATSLWVCIDLATKRPMRAPKAYVEACAPNGALTSDSGHRR